MLRYTGVTIGTMIIEQGDSRYKIQIRQGNCLAVMIHCRKDDNSEGYIHTLYTFFADEQHIKNIIKNEGRLFFDKVISARLNLKYKESVTLAKYFAMQKIKTSVYYK